MNVQVVFASRHGGTAGIAERIAEVLRGEGANVAVADARDRPDSTGFDAFVVGSGVYLGNWLKEGIEFLEWNLSLLAATPVWLFSSGPLPGSSKNAEGSDPLTLALGPEEGPGSGGHKKIASLTARIRPRDHAVFQGAFNPNDAPKSIPERLIRMMPAAKEILPPGDFREWDAIDAWAHNIAVQLAARVPVG